MDTKTIEKKLVVDPGFVNHRKIDAILGEAGTEIINNAISKIPANTPGWKKDVDIDHIYSRVLLEFCNAIGIKTLEEALLLVQYGPGQIICSNIKTHPCENLYDVERAVILCEKFEGSELNVELHLTTKKIRADTLRSHMHKGGEFTVIALFSEIQNSRIIYEPLIIGFPYIVNVKTGDLLWERYNDVYQIYPEDFEEFSKVKEIEIPSDFDEMRNIKETVLKSCLGKILSESTPKDWGGEMSDFFTSHLHLNGKRVKAAFLLKGPAKFSPMTLSHLGKNSDQIVRLSKEPADILILQHCHDILPVVIETLKVFATQPSNPRRYCVIDGRESLRLLNAYDLTQWAIKESSVQNASNG